MVVVPSGPRKQGDSNDLGARLLELLDADGPRRGGSRTVARERHERLNRLGVSLGVGATAGTALHGGLTPTLVGRPGTRRLLGFDAYEASHHGSRRTHQSLGYRVCRGISQGLPPLAHEYA